MPTLTDIRLADLLDTYFGAIGDVEDQREVAGGMTWRASLLGSCLRRQWLELVEKRPKARIDARTQRIFQVGHLTGELVKRAFETAGVLIAEELPLTGEEWNVGAHVDFLIGGPIQQGDSDPLAVVVRERLRQAYGPELPVIGVELKSKNSKSFWWAKKQKTTVAGENQLIQAATYDLLAQKKAVHVDRWAVLTIAKDDLTMAEDAVLPQHREEALRRLQALNQAQSASDLPCDCLTTWNGKGWKYCPYGVDEMTCC